MPAKPFPVAEAANPRRRRPTPPVSSPASSSSSSSNASISRHCRSHHLRRMRRENRKWKRMMRMARKTDAERNRRQSRAASHSCEGDPPFRRSCCRFDCSRDSRTWMRKKKKRKKSGGGKRRKEVRKLSLEGRPDQIRNSADARWRG